MNYYGVQILRDFGCKIKIYHKIKIYISYCFVLILGDIFIDNNSCINSLKAYGIITFDFFVLFLHEIH